MLSPAVWGRGFGTEAATAIRDEAFERVGLDFVFALYYPENAASGRILEKLGMVYERDVIDQQGEALARVPPDARALGSGAVSDVAVVLMAYGSPERLADVPAYYADIRGGRPIRPELLEHLLNRYRALGIEDGSPLNAITEQTRAALERELGVPVYTGMKHWQPRIADAVEAALAGGATTIVGLVLAPHYSRLSIGGYREQVERALAGRAELRFVDSWHDDEGLIELFADRVRGSDAHVVFTAHSLPARILDEGDPYEDELLATSRAIARRADAERVELLVPERIRHGRAVARARHPRSPGGPPRARRPRRPRLPDRVRVRPPRDPLGHRHGGGRTGARTGHAPRPDRDAERRSAVRARARGDRAGRRRRARAGMTVALQRLTAQEIRALAPELERRYADDLERDGGLEGETARRKAAEDIPQLLADPTVLMFAIERRVSASAGCASASASSSSDACSGSGTCSSTKITADAVTGAPPWSWQRSRRDGSASRGSS